MKKVAVQAEIVMDEASIEEAEKKAQEEAMTRISALSQTLTKKRDEAVRARTESGVEDDWNDDEDAYEGIDDANRDLHRNRAKPLSPEGGTTKDIKTDMRSRVFLNITRPYVDAAAAKVADMLLPTDEQNWALDETPIPEMVDASKDNAPLIMPDGAPVPMIANGQQKQMTVADQAKMILERAKEAAKKAEKRIDDWLAECNYNSEVRKVIEDSARIGVGVMKGPYPDFVTKNKISKEQGLTAVTQETKLIPASRAISPWNLYPDPACGNNIHKGSYIFEKDRLTKREVEELLDNDVYIAEMVEKVLEEGPQRRYLDNEPQVEKGGGLLNDKETYDVWYYYGFIKPEDLQVMGCECDPNAKAIPALVMMINDSVIMAAENPNKAGEFPYDVMPWQRRIDHWTGVGVGRQMRTPQRMLNAATRNMMDNAGLSAGPQLVLKKGVIEPANGVWEITPRKVWYQLEDDAGNVAEAFVAINIPTMQNELMNIINFAQKMAEDVTGLPMLIQGQQGAAPETVGGMQMLNNNASTVMRRISRTFDDNITEPHIRRYYQWLLDDPEVPEEEKGDYKIIARGSSALVERDIQNQTIAQMGTLVLNPAFGINPKKWIEQYYKSQRLDPNEFLYTEDELAKMQEQAAQNPPPQDPRIEAVKLRNQFDAEKMQQEHAYEIERLDRQERIEMLRLAQSERITLAEIKAMLADTALKERNKRDIFDAEANLKLSAGSGI